MSQRNQCSLQTSVDFNFGLDWAVFIEVIEKKKKRLVLIFAFLFSGTVTYHVICFININILLLTAWDPYAYSVHNRVNSVHTSVTL